MTEETNVVTLPKPKRKPGRKPKPKPEPDEFAGMTALSCCDACTAQRCIVSGLNVCSHPRKGGLQSVQLSDAKAIARFNRAKDYLTR